ncbi:hypothetical protein QUF70_12425 [Desulfobacterales bacterium HSG17]|nr:hypothetical protein [Desulfobacterales bacterium HSG17]
MKKDYAYLGFIIALLILISLGIRTYDESLKPESSSSGTKEFILTGHSQKGWILGDIKAWDMLSLFKKGEKNKKPVIRVSLNDNVIIKLRSADVSHGFALKEYGIYVSKGIEPGSTRYVKFKADKAGTFIFACNVYCGDMHNVMQGTLVVEK